MGTMGMMGTVGMSRRRWLAGSGLAFATGALAACGTGASSTKTGAAPVAAKPTGTIEFWQGWSTRTPQLRTYLDQFEQQNPGTKVADQEAAQLGGRAKLVANVIAGTMPDCLMVFKADYPLLVPAKVLVGLNKYVARDKIDLQQFGEADVKDRTFNGDLVAMPSASGASGNGSFLYWNKELFKQGGLNPEQPPKTWAELDQVVPKLTQGQDRVALNPGGRFLPWLYANNGSLYADKEGKKVGFDTTEARDTLRYLAQLVQKQGGSGDLLEKTGIDTRQWFYQGRYAMFLESDLFPSLLRVDALGQTVNWGVALLPANEKNSKAKFQIPSRGGHGYSVMTQAKNAEGAWALAKFLTLGDAQCNFMIKDQGRVSTLKRCNTDPSALSKPEFQVFNKTIAAVVSLPFSPGDDVAVAALEKHAQTAVSGKVSIDDALKNAVQEAQQALDDGWRQWRG